MLSNPMMLMMVFGGGMMLAMPYLVVSKRIDCHARDLQVDHRKTLTQSHWKSSRSNKLDWQGCRMQWHLGT